MRYMIGKRFEFCAGHQLPGLPADHPCSRLHGHNYTVEVILGADDLEEPGFVTDFRALAPLRRYLQETFDHRHLNDVLDVPATSEHLAVHVARWAVEHLPPEIAGRLRAVRVGETPSTWAEVLVEPRS
jgi:6-pyruvoyltetrahydropterin/6-carboxytetrahydropterin synthase